MDGTMCADQPNTVVRARSRRLTGVRITQSDDKKAVRMCHTCPSTAIILKKAHIADAMKSRGRFARPPRIVTAGTRLADGLLPVSQPAIPYPGLMHESPRSIR